MRQAVPPVPQVPAVQNNGSPSSIDVGQIIRNSVGDLMQNIRVALTSELDAATADRTAAQSQLGASRSAAERAKLQERIAKDNATIAKVRAGIANIDSKAPAVYDGTSGTSVPPRPRDYRSDVPEQMIISVMGIVFIGFPLAIAFARIIWRRGNQVQAQSKSQLPADSTRRFDQLEHAVDSIAIEVERISENQRYLTKLLSETRQPVAVGAGRGEPPPQS